MSDKPTYGTAIEDSTQHPSGEGHSVRVLVHIPKPTPPDIQILREDQDPDILKKPKDRSRIYWAWYCTWRRLRGLPI